MAKILWVVAVAIALSALGGGNIGAAVTNYKKGNYSAFGINIFFALFFALTMIIYMLKQSIM